MGKKIAIFIFLFLIQIGAVNALSLDKNDFVIGKGAKESTNLYVDTEESINKVQFSLIYTTYDVPAVFTLASDANLSVTSSSIVYTITFKEAKSGRILLGTIDFNSVKSPKGSSGNINLHTATARSIDGNSIKLNPQSINVTISDEEVLPQEEQVVVDTPKTYNLLSSVESKIAKIKILDDVFEYDINIPDDVETLDLKPVAKNETYKVEISNQKISELQDGKIKVTVTSDKNEVQNYIFNVKILKTSNIKEDKEEFKKDNSYKGKIVVLMIASIAFLALGILLIKKKI